MLSFFNILASNAVYVCFQCELSTVLYPVFVHMYLQLIYNDHEDEGTKIKDLWFCVSASLISSNSLYNKVIFANFD